MPSVSTAEVCVVEGELCSRFKSPRRAASSSSETLCSTTSRLGRDPRPVVQHRPLSAHQNGYFLSVPGSKAASRRQSCDRRRAGSAESRRRVREHFPAAKLEAGRHPHHRFVGGQIAQREQAAIRGDGVCDPRPEVTAVQRGDTVLGDCPQ